MRPVNKGQKPVEYKHYRDAEPYLEQRLGTYCSFCEMDISHAPKLNIKRQSREAVRNLNGITCYFPANTAIHVKAFM